MVRELTATATGGRTRPAGRSDGRAQQRGVRRELLLEPVLELRVDLAHPALGHAELLADLRLRQVAREAQGEDAPLALGEVLDEPADRDGLLLRS